MSIKPGFLPLILAALPLAAGNVATATVTTKLLAPLNLTINNQPSFGTVILTDATLGGTVTVDAKGAATAGGAGGVAVSGNTSQALAMTLTSSGSAAFQVTFDPAIQMTGPGDAKIDVTITEVKQNGLALASGPGGYTGTTDLSGSTSLAVGASMLVNPNQTLGSYSGSFNVTVTYQ